MIQNTQERKEKSQKIEQFGNTKLMIGVLLHGKGENLGQWVFIPVLDHNESLVTPVHLNVILTSLFKY